MEENNVFTAKTVDEAIEAGLSALGITLSDAEIEIIEEGKKRLFGSVKAKVRVTKKESDSERAVEFINGLLKILNVEGAGEVVSEEENIKIEIKCTNTARVIGKRGDVLDAIQTLAGAAANIGREEYRKVVVDCENYRTQREETLKNLALKIAAKAVETGRKIILEPMNPYERRIIHATLVGNTDVKTISEGNEPVRHIVVVPNNAKPYDKGVRYGERRGNDRGDRNARDRDRRGSRERKGGFESRDRDRRGGDRRQSGGSSGAKRGKKEIYFGTYLGNSNAAKTENEEKKDEE